MYSNIAICDITISLMYHKSVNTYDNNALNIGSLNILHLPTPLYIYSSHLHMMVPIIYYIDGRHALHDGHHNYMKYMR